MTKKPKQSKKATRSSKRTKSPAQHEDETVMVATSTPAEAPEASRSTPEGEVPVESEQAVAAAPPGHTSYTTNIWFSQRWSKGKHQRGIAAASDCGKTYQAAIDSCLREGRIPSNLAQAHRKIRHHTRNISGRAGKRCSGCTAHPSRQACCGENKRDGVKPLFTLGRVVATPGALAAIGVSGDDLSTYLARHQSGDWGEIGEHDKKENQLSLEQGSRLMTVYTLNITGSKIWVITEADRSSTCILLPEEY